MSDIDVVWKDQVSELVVLHIIIMGLVLPAAYSAWVNEKNAVEDESAMPTFVA